jgi:hypothetical protein
MLLFYVEEAIMAEKDEDGPHVTKKILTKSGLLG